MSRAFAYARVSTVEQLTENQAEQIAQAGYQIPPRRFIEEKVSGSVPTSQRPGYQKLMDRMEEGDTLIVTKLDRIGRRVAANHRAAFDYDGKLVEAVLARCTEVDTGARNVDHILTGTLLPEIAQTVLARMAAGTAIGKIKVSAATNGDFKYAVH